MSTNFKVKTKKLQNEQQRATLDFKHNEISDNIASPAPILSTEFFAKASDNLYLLPFLS